MMEQLLINNNFWDKVDKGGCCWIWTAGVRGGYGGFKVNRKLVDAHRYAFELTKGKIPEGLQIDHLCRNHSCVNPEHLEAVTQRENVLRGYGVCANNSRKTHCKRGHELIGNNLGHEKYSTKRRCKTCDRNNAKIRQRKYRERLRFGGMS